MTINAFEMVHASPNLQDVEEGFGEGSRSELGVAAQRFQAVIAGVLETYRDALNSNGVDPVLLAEFIQQSAAGAKGYATDKRHLVKQLTTLRQLCLRAVDQSQPD